MSKVLITDRVHPLLIEGLTAKGFDCTYLPKIDQSKVRELIPAFEGIVINSKITMNKAMMDEAPQLQFIARLGSGLEIVDLEYAKQRGIAVIRAPDGNCDAVAEHAMGMLLSLSNNLQQANTDVKNFDWQREKNRGWELKGKTIGIVGFGYTGQALAKRLQGFEMQILVYDKYATVDTDAYPYVQAVEMLVIFEQADILSLHLPLTEETIGLADIDYWNKFKKSIVLVNTSRGLVVPTEGLIEALDQGMVRAACLDVLENEKPSRYSEEEKRSYQDLFSRTNVMLSPHVAGWTIESKERLAQLLLDRILMV